MMKKLLCLSNGHGEDVIAVRILEQLQRHPKAPEIAALPLVGKGHAYINLDIPIVGPVQQMPSGGFIYMDGKQLWQDLQGGLFRLTLAQYKVVRSWAKSGGQILAVGDIVPLLFAWLSGADYSFVGTAKSDYYLRDETGWLPQTSTLERWFGSVYLPWERMLMSNRRCKAVFPRDTLTTDILLNWSIPAVDLGNPMMDGIVPNLTVERTADNQETLVILLLPGSRLPEAERNWEKIVRAIAATMTTLSHRLVFIGAIAPNCDLAPFETYLLSQGWQRQPLNSVSNPIGDTQALAFTLNGATVLLTQDAYADALLQADLAIAMAGTATEQFVGLGKPAIAMPGDGPQFTFAFAEAQTRLLGISVILVANPTEVGTAIQSLLNDPDELHLIAQNGRRRMGKKGAATRIASHLATLDLDKIGL